MNQCHGVGEEAAAPRQALREDRKHIANGYLCLRGSAPPSSPYPDLFSHFCFPSQSLTQPHPLKGHTPLIKIILITKGAVQFISDPPAMDTVPGTASRSTPPSSFTPEHSSFGEKGNAQGTIVCPGLPALFRAVPPRAHTSEPKKQHLSHLELMTPSMQ